MQKLFVSSLQLMAVALAIGLLAPTDLLAQSGSRSAAPQAAGSGLRTLMPQQSIQAMPQETIISQPAGSASRVEMPSVLGSSGSGTTNMMPGEMIVSDPMTSYAAPMESAPMESYSAPMASSPCCETAPAPVQCCPETSTRGGGLRAWFRSRR